MSMISRSSIRSRSVSRPPDSRAVPVGPSRNNIAGGSPLRGACPGGMGTDVDDPHGRANERAVPARLEKDLDRVLLHFEVAFAVRADPVAHCHVVSREALDRDV